MRSRDISHQTIHQDEPKTKKSPLQTSKRSSNEGYRQKVLFSTGTAMLVNLNIKFFIESFRLKDPKACEWMYKEDIKEFT